jgi:RNA polymerase sigma-70 factor (ECF subfamily)
MPVSIHGSSRQPAHGELPSDETLVIHARGGDLDAFNLLVTRHQRTVFGVTARYLRSRELAEDVTQEAFLRAWRSLGSCRVEAGYCFRAWLLRIATNLALDCLRAQTRRPLDSLDDRRDGEESDWEPEASAESPADFAVRGDLALRLERLLGQLHPDHRLVVILSDVQGLSYGEVAGIAGVPVGTVKSRISRGRAQLRAILRADPLHRELLAS